jgi:hypothetical protein
MGQLDAWRLLSDHRLDQLHTFWIAFPISAPRIFSKGTLSIPITSTLLGPFFMMEPASSRPMKDVPMMATLVFSLMAEERH